MFFALGLGWKWPSEWVLGRFLLVWADRGEWPGWDTHPPRQPSCFWFCLAYEDSFCLLPSRFYRLYNAGLLIALSLLNKVPALPLWDPAHALPALVKLVQAKSAAPHYLLFLGSGARCFTPSVSGYLSGTSSFQWWQVAGFHVRTAAIVFTSLTKRFSVYLP